MKVLKIGAVWCAGCIVMKPRWKEIESEYPDLQTEYFEYDDHPELMEKYGVVDAQLPVFIFLDSNGQEIHRVQGELSKKEIIKLIEKYKNE